MKTIAFFSFPLDLELTSFGMLAKLAKTGNQVHVVVVGNSIKLWTRRCKDLLDESCKIIGVDSLSFTDRFDYSSVTQDNALILKSIIREVGPELAIIPFWKAHNHKLNILSNTSLIACRGIGNILMYNSSKNSKFNPNVYVKLSESEAHIKLNRLLDYRLSNQLQGRYSALLYPNVIYDHDKIVPAQLIAKDNMSSFIRIGSSSLRGIRRDRLNTEKNTSKHGNKVFSSKLSDVTDTNKKLFYFSLPEGEELSEIYESHRVLLV